MIRKSTLLNLFIALTILLAAVPSSAQLIMNATNGSNAYTVINNKLAPNHVAVEAPDQTTGNSVVGTHPSFGRHIAMVYDATAPNTVASSTNPNPNYVFEFYVHPLNDNDVSTGDADRQRVEMKTYDVSPDSLKATLGETVTYSWYFRLPAGFQPSPTFTHIHQVKPVTGDTRDPLFTITPTATSSGNVLMVRYMADSVQGNSSTPYTTLASAPLSSF